MAIFENIFAIALVAYAAGVLALLSAVAVHGVSECDAMHRSIEIFLWPLLAVLLVLFVLLYAARSAGEWYGKRQAKNRVAKGKL